MIETKESLDLLIQTIQSQDRFAKYVEHGTRELLCGKYPPHELLVVDEILKVRFFAAMATRRRQLTFSR
jgi:hypothetical protein